jgi:hypothetical protein
MAFWNTAPEVNRQYRWYMVFGSDVNKFTFALKKAAKPTMKISEVQHKYLNHFFYYPGRVEWEPISVTFASVKTLDSADTADSLLIKALVSSGYQLPAADAPGNYKTISKTNAIAQLTGESKGGTSVRLSQIDADGNIVENWRLFNPFFTEVKYDSLDYSSEEILNIDVTIKYDYATLDNEEGNLLLGQ